MSRVKTHEANLFGKNLSQVLNALGMTQADLAERAGLTPACVSQVLAGKREPTLYTIMRILRVVPVKFERLMQS